MSDLVGNHIVGFPTRGLIYGSVILQEQVIMQFCAHKLDKKDFFGKSDPFLTFYRANEDNRYKN